MPGYTCSGFRLEPLCQLLTGRGTRRIEEFRTVSEITLPLMKVTLFLHTCGMAGRASRKVTRLRTDLKPASVHGVPCPMGFRTYLPGHSPVEAVWHVLTTNEMRAESSRCP